MEAEALQAASVLCVAPVGWCFYRCCCIWRRPGVGRARLVDFGCGRHQQPATPGVHGTSWWAQHAKIDRSKHASLRSTPLSEVVFYETALPPGTLRQRPGDPYEQTTGSVA